MHNIYIYNKKSQYNRKLAHGFCLIILLRTRLSVGGMWYRIKMMSNWRAGIDKQRKERCNNCLKANDHVCIYSQREIRTKYQWLIYIFVWLYLICFASWRHKRFYLQYMHFMVARLSLMIIKFKRGKMDMIIFLIDSLSLE